MRIDHYDLQGEVQYRQQQAQSRKVRNLGPVPPAVNPPEGNNTAAAGERSSTLTLTSALTLQTARQSAASQPAATPPAPPRPQRTSAKSRMVFPMMGWITASD